tara:strand:- start:384 stop:626 length:243 start_codon:yes stop_codon:yes gene_type:complete
VGPHAKPSQRIHPRNLGCEPWNAQDPLHRKVICFMTSLQLTKKAVVTYESTAAKREGLNLHFLMDRTSHTMSFGAKVFWA